MIDRWTTAHSAIDWHLDRLEPDLMVVAQRQLDEERRDRLGEGEA